MPGITHGSDEISAKDVSRNRERFDRTVEVVKKLFPDTAVVGERGLFVGSYGRGTAIDSSTVDVLVDIPGKNFGMFEGKMEGREVLRQGLVDAFGSDLSRSENIITREGHVMLEFVSGMGFEVIPAFYGYPHQTGTGYIYQTAENGYRSKDPKRDNDAMKKADEECGGLLTDTCRHLRHVRDGIGIGSDILPGMVIDSFVYAFIDTCRYRWDGDRKVSDDPDFRNGTYEDELMFFLDFEMTIDKNFKFRTPSGERDVRFDNRTANGLRFVLRSLKI